MSKRQKKQAQPEENGATTPPPAYFLSVTVENVRCFGEAQTLDLSNGNGRPAQWTVILGDNGTGKTTLLQAIAALEARKSERPGELRPRDLVNSKGFVEREAYRRKGAYPAKMSGICFVGAKLKENGREGRRINGFSVGDVMYKVQFYQDLGGLHCYAYGASRHMAETRLKKNEIDDATATLFSDDIGLPSVEEWLLRADYASRVASSERREQWRKWREQLIKMLIGLLPDVDSIEFHEPGPPPDPDWRPGVEFRTPYGWVTIDQLSLGYRTMIAWTVDVARRLFERYPDSDNPLAEPAVVLVDEIDLHLHPQWQHGIIEFLSERFPNTQFIVTAHSPLVVQAAADANIALLRREGDHVVIENDLQAIRNWRIDQILTSDLFGLESARPPHLDGLLKQRREILSKGKLTKADKKKLEELEVRIGELPAGETPEDIKAMDVIRRAAAWLEKNPDAVYDPD